MTRDQAREAARDILQIIPLVMRAVAAQLRSAGELPAPAHFGLLSMLSERSRTLTELASSQGVTLPTGCQLGERARTLAEHRQRSEEHTSELQSPYDLVCRLLLAKKKKNK